MPDTAVQLGSFTFQDFEVPERIPFPGTQDLGVHKLIGGQKVVDAMGYFVGDLEWSGRFRGLNALSRALQVQALVKAGQQVALTWGALSYVVVPKTFTPDYERAYEIPYSLVLEVISDQSSPAMGSNLPTLDDQISEDMGLATDYGASIRDPSLTSGLTSLSAAITSVQTFSGASQVQIGTVLAPIDAALARTTVLIAQNNAVVTSTSTFGGLVAGGPPSVMAESLTAQTAAMLLLANLTALESLLTRMQINLQADGASGAEVIVAGGNLYDIAAETYGDPSEWTTIAAANGLTDPFLAGVNTLTVPTTPSRSGGVWPT